MSLEIGAGVLAILFCIMFTGIAAYVSIVEHPARGHIPLKAALTHWKKSYSRGFVMQGTLAAVSGMFGLIQYAQTGGGMWLIGAVMILLNWPVTLLLIDPLNRRLMAIEKIENEKDTAYKLEMWGKLHALRTAFGLAALLAYSDALPRLAGG